MLTSGGGTDGKHQRASSRALGGNLTGENRRENAAERDGQRPGDTPAPPMMGRVGRVGAGGRRTASGRQ